MDQCGRAIGACPPQWGTNMKTTRSGYLFSYWPVAMAVVLVAMAALHAYGDRGTVHEPLAAEQVTAELARAVSYGIIDAGAARTAPVAHRGRAAASTVTPEAS
jgi:hypothetical protein